MKVEYSGNAKRLRALLAAAGVETQAFDVHAHMDRKISYRENKANLQRLAHVSQASGQTRHAQRYQRAARTDDPFYQTGQRTEREIDKAFKAKLPGKRVAKKSGRKYTERRYNRSDRHPGLRY